MVNYKDIFKYFRLLIKNRLESSLGRTLSVIQARTTGAKPKNLYATLDILTTTDVAGYLTNKWFDSTTNEVVYETYKDVHVMVSIRNGDPNDFDAQMDVYSMADSVHKAFAEEGTIDYIADKMKATIKSLSIVRPIIDTTPTGLANGRVFSVYITAVDETREAMGWIEAVKIHGTILDMNGVEIETSAPIPP